MNNISRVACDGGYFLFGADVFDDDCSFRKNNHSLHPSHHATCRNTIDTVGLCCYRRPTKAQQTERHYKKFRIRGELHRMACSTAAAEYPSMYSSSRVVVIVDSPVRPSLIVALLLLFAFCRPPPPPLLSRPARLDV